MIDSSKKRRQRQGFSEIVPAGGVESLKEKACPEAGGQKSLKEGQSLAGRGQKTQNCWADSGHLHLGWHAVCQEQSLYINQLFFAL